VISSGYIQVVAIAPANPEYMSRFHNGKTGVMDVDVCVCVDVFVGFAMEDWVVMSVGGAVVRPVWDVDTCEFAILLIFRLGVGFAESKGWKSMVTRWVLWCYTVMVVYNIWNHNLFTNQVFVHVCSCANAYMCLPEPPFPSSNLGQWIPYTGCRTLSTEHWISYTEH